MSIYFLDSSAIAKRYINEIGSNWLCSLFEPTLGNQFFITAITGVEIISAITRRAKSGSISSRDSIAIRNQFKEDIQSEYQVIEITETIISSAMTMAEIYALRGYDAVQLASGREINSLCILHNLPVVIFVSADNALNEAASAEGLVIENPNNYR